MSDSLQPHGLQHARLPCPSLSPRVYSNSCPLSRYCFLTISSSSALFSFAFNFSQHQGLFQWLSSSHQVPKYWSFSFSINPSNEYSLFISLGIDWFDLPEVQRTVVFSSTTIQKHRFFSTLSSLWPNSHIHTWLLEKPSLSLYGSLSAKWCLCFLICCLGLS